MKVFDQKHIKNVVLLGAPKSGKTTLTETMLFEAGLITRRGTVEDQTTVSDYHAVEHERGNSVYATTLHTEWKDYKINILDTPGLDDFIGEVAASVRVADTAVVLINSQQGVEIATEQIWNYIDRFKKPTIIAINQVDHPKSDFYQSYESIKKQLGSAAVLVQYPMEQGEQFSTIIDLLTMTAYRFGEEGGKPQKLPIPAQEKERANQLHNVLVEAVAEHDESLMELYFEQGTLDEVHMKEGLKKAMLHHDLFPVFCLSAKKDMGSGRLMGFIDFIAPSYVDLFPETPIVGNAIANKLESPASVLIFKTQVEPFLGKVNFFKVMSGSVKTGDELLNQRTGQLERISQLFIMDGHRRNPINQLNTGDIGATLKLKASHTNDTLHDPNVSIQYAPIEFPDIKVKVAVSAENRQEEEALADALKQIQEEDPTLLFEYNKDVKQLILGGQGDLHLQLVKWRIENINKINIHFESPRIPYVETIQKSATLTYKHKKQSGGAGQFAEVTLTVMPYVTDMENPTGFNVRSKELIDLPWGGQLMFYNCIVGGVIDARFFPSVIKGVLEVMEQAPVTGSHARDVAVILHDGKMHAVDSNDISFKIAGASAFKEAFLHASPLLMEPIYRLDILTPENYVGEVMTDLQSRRGIILDIDSQHGKQWIKARAPLAELSNYATSLKSASQGRASFTTTFEAYFPMPFELQEKLMKIGRDMMVV